MKIKWMFFTLILWLAAACSAVSDISDSAFEETPDLSGDLVMVEKLAPIDRVEILMADPPPADYILLVESGLPNGCAVFDRYEMNRDGTTIHIEIFNQEAVGMACTEIYGIVEHQIPLDSDFNLETTYTILINDWIKTFVPQELLDLPEESMQIMIDRAMVDLSERIAVDISVIQLVEALSVTWPNGSLGCPEPGMMYTEALVPGYRILLEYENKIFAYHTDLSEQIVFCPRGTKLPVDLDEIQDGIPWVPVD